MDRALDHQEKEKVRTSRANFFQVLKRKDSSSQSMQHRHKTTTSTNQPDPPSTNKRFKLPTMSPSRSSDSGSNVPLIIRFYDPDTPAPQANDAHGRTLEEILSWHDVELERSHNYIQMLFPLPEGSLFNWEAPVITHEVFVAFRSNNELKNRLRRSLERMLDFYGFTVSTKPEEDKETPEAGGAAGQASQDEMDPEQVPPAANATEKAAEGEDQGTTALPDTSEFEIDAAVIVGTIADTIDISEASTTQASPNPPSISNPQPHYSPLIGYYVVRGPNWRRSFRNWAVRFDHNHLRITRILRCLRVLGLQTECDAFFTALKRVFDDPAIHINERSMTYWQYAVTRPLYIAPDGDRCGWLKKWEEEQKQVADGGEKQKITDG